MPEILRREDMELTASIANGTWVKGVGLDLDKPWNHCWSLIGSHDVKERWTGNFKDHNTMILTGVKTMDSYLAGDANITASSRDHLPATGTETPAIANLRTKPPPAKTTRAIKDREPNLKSPACDGFNSGECNAMQRQAIRALRMVAEYTSAASAAMESIRTWNAFKYPASQLVSLPAPAGNGVTEHLSASDSGAHGRNPTVGDSEAQTSRSITIQDASRLMSRICLRRSLAASGIIRHRLLLNLHRHGGETLQPPEFRLMSRDTLWSLRRSAWITSCRQATTSKTP